MQILVLTDGKKGHENQSVGLAEALIHRLGGRYQLQPIAEALPPATPRPDLVISAGHRTHWRLLRIARQFRSPSVVVMKPSLPSSLFTACLIPEHDLKGATTRRDNVIVTTGALNKIPETTPPKNEEGLIMLGGPSKHFSWELPPLLEAIQEIVTRTPQLTWTLGDSRRTPAETLAAVEALSLPLNLAPHQEATGSWLADHLLSSREAWITPDSTSMLSEALTAGCRVGTLPLPALDTRLSRAHERLAEGRWLTPYQKNFAQGPLSAPPERLNETGRCADLLIERLSLRP